MDLFAALFAFLGVTRGKIIRCCGCGLGHRFSGEFGYELASHKAITGNRRLFQGNKKPDNLEPKRRDYRAPQNGDIKEKQWH
ncbi:hypothetical protein M8494_16850 [Serratia ureilytica]